MILFQVPTVWKDLLDIVDIGFAPKSPGFVAVNSPSEYRYDERTIVDADSGIEIVLSSGFANYYVFFAQDHDYTEADHVLAEGEQEIELNNRTYQVRVELV